MADAGSCRPLSRRRARISLNESLNECVSSSTDLASDKILLSGLLRVQWKTYHTSLVLDKDRKELNERSCLAITKIISGKCAKEEKINVILTNCSGIQLDMTSPKAVLVEVLFSGQMVYQGYFLNWSTDNEGIEQMDELPILLVKAKKTVMKIVHSALIDTFDFVITPMYFTVPQLAMFFVNFVNTADREDGKFATLKYSVPGAPKNSFITVSVRVKDLCVIFDFFESVIPDVQELIPFFYEKLLNHLQNSYRLDFSIAQLRQVSLPEAMATDAGIVQAKNENDLLSVLNVLSICLDRPPPPPPLTSFSSEES